MADASCSGTTPYKRLIDHQTRDASHHQDRLVNHSGGNDYGSFRSAPQPAQGQAGFEAFMNGASGLSAVPHPHDSAARLSAHAAALRPAPTPDFVSSARSSHQLGPQARASPVGNVANWATDFARFNGQRQRPFQPPQPAMAPSAASVQLSQLPPPQMNFQTAFGMQAGGFQGFSTSSFPQSSAVAAPQPGFDAELSRWMASHGDGAGMEQVDAAMEQMARELELNDEALAEAETSVPLQEQPSVREEAHFTDLETPEIGSLSLEPNVGRPSEAILEEAQAGDQPAGRSAVSEAAERLLESVQGEQGDKWKNSAFLSLMRDFRDGKKDIVDNEIRQSEGGDDSLG